MSVVILCNNDPPIGFAAAHVRTQAEVTDALTKHAHCTHFVLVGPEIERACFGTAKVTPYFRWINHGTADSAMWVAVVPVEHDPQDAKAVRFWRDLRRDHGTRVDTLPEVPLACVTDGDNHAAGSRERTVTEGVAGVVPEVQTRDDAAAEHNQFVVEHGSRKARCTEEEHAHIVACIAEHPPAAQEKW